jgi:hypothetical protein
MKLFSEKVNPTFTNSALNILTVKDFDEVFFDVYEFEINGKTFTAEKVAKHNGSPVVNIPIVIGEKEFLAPFILKRGQFFVEFNKKNTTYIGTTSIDLPEPEIDIVEEEIETQKALPELFLEQINISNKSSKMLFDQEVEVTNSNVDHNILVVENYHEVFFDVYEIKINNKKYHTEKISTYKSRPVVNVPIIYEGKEYIAPFVLEKGQQEIFFNKNNIQFVKEIKEEEIKLPEIEEKSNWSEEIVLEKKQEIIQDIVKARKIARKYAEDIKKAKIEEANLFIVKKEEEVDNLLQTTRNELTKEFLSIIDKTTCDLKEESKANNNNLTEYVTSFIIKESNRLSESAELLNENNIKYFENKILDLVKNVYTNNLTKLINEKDSSNLLKYSKLFKETKNTLEHLLEENNLSNKILFDNFKKEVDSNLTVLEKTNINLENKFDRGLNKALSRVGNVKTDTLKEVNSKIKLTENKITDVYKATLTEVNLQIEKRVEEVSYINEKIDNLKKSTTTVLSDTNKNIDTVNKDIEDLKSQKNILNEKIDQGRKLLNESETRLKTLNNESNKENKKLLKGELLKLKEYNNNSTKKLVESIKDTKEYIEDTNKNILDTIQRNEISLTSLLETKLENTNDTITSLLENKLKTVDNKFKEHLKLKIRESQNSLFKEVDELKKSFSEQVIIEKLQLPEKNKEINIQDVKKDLEKKISLKFTNELTAIRRYLDSYGGGGGSVAKQFANGGTMDGDLNVTGHILSGGINLLNVLSATSGGGGGGDIEGVFGGLGLTGGGTSGTLTLNVSAGNGIDATANCITVDNTVARCNALNNFTGGLSAMGLSALASNSGFISAGKDLNSLFSNCQGTVTSVTGGTGIDSSGGVTPEISIDSTVAKCNTLNTFTGGLSAVGLSALAANSGFVSAGRDLSDIFATSSGNVDGSGTANFLPVWSDTDTLGNSISFETGSSSPLEACQLTVMGDISARGSLSALDVRVGADSIRMNGPAGTIITSGAIQGGGSITANTALRSNGGTSCFGGTAVNICEATPLVACGCVRIGQGVTGGSPLTVSGNISAHGSLSATGAGYNYFCSRVGIGTSAPSQKLTVAGGVSAIGLSAMTANQGFVSAGRDLAEIFKATSSIISKSSLDNGGIIDTFSTSDMKATKYAIQVLSGNDVHFSDISITTDGTNTGIVEYGINHTTANPFVEFGAFTISTTVFLTAKEVASADMEKFSFKGNRLNLFS